MGVVEFLTQSFGKLAYIDLAIIAAYMLLCLYVGCKGIGKIRNIKDYTLGSGNISTATLVATLYATYLGAGATIGTVERVSAIGAVFAVTLFVKPISWWLAYIIFGKNIKQFKGYITSADIMMSLYGNFGRFISIICSVLLNVATVAAQAIAIGYLLSYFLEIPLALGVFIGMGTIIFYSAIGGVRAVVVTDVFQFSIFYVLFPILCGLLLYEMGGWEKVNEMIPADKWSMKIDTSDKAYIFWGSILYMILPEHSAPFIQRFLMSMNPLQLKRSLIIISLIDLSVILTICIFGFILSIGIGGDITASNIIWHMMNEQLLFILKGLAVVGVVAIIMSTADSYLNVSGALIARNVLKHYFPKMTSNIELVMARLVTLLVGVMAMSLALFGSSVLQMVWLAVNFYCPIITVPLVAGFLKFRTNSRTFIVSVCVAIIGTLMGAYVQESFDVLSTAFGLFGSAIGLFGMHYFQKATGTLNNVAAKAVVEEEEKNIEQRVFNYKQVVPRMMLFIKQCFFRMKYLKLKYIVSYSKLSVKKYHPRYYEFAIIGIIFSIYPLVFPKLIYGMAPKAAEEAGLMTVLWLMDIVMRIATALGCIGLALQEKWKKENRVKYLPIYFHLMIMCTLSILGTYSCLVFPENQNFVVPGILAIFVMGLLVDRFTFTIIAFTGFILGNLFYLWFAWASEYTVVYADIIDIEILYLFLALVTAWLLHFIKDKQAKLEIDAWHKLAITDKLTSLYNRHYFDMRLEAALGLAKNRDRALSMLIIDIDHFKRVNDSYGHLFGDNMLQKVASYMLKNIRPGDICARVGGEEFIILMPETGLKDAEVIAERLRAEIEGLAFSIPFAPYNTTCTISIGLTQAVKADTPDSFKDRADKALYRAKNGGRNKVVSVESKALEIPVDASSSEAAS